MKLKTILRMHTFHMHPRLGNISKDRSALVFGLLRPCLTLAVTMPCVWWQRGR